MRNLRVGQAHYVLPGSDGAIALAHALGNAFIELQQLEYSIISYLDVLAGGEIGASASFDLFASKTFGNLIREMRKHEFLKNLADDLGSTKEKRDFFVHKFLFHRYGGDMLTTDSEYELLIREAHDLGVEFGKCQAKFHDQVLETAPIVMFAAKLDADSGELIIVESEYAKERRVSDSG
ncbi:MAG TPA: hypothetical protein VII56_08470 [Rhizomicrobium sp.]